MGASCHPCLRINEDTIQSIYLSIYLSIYGIYIAPFQDNYSEALPGEKKGLGEFVKGVRQIPW